MLTTGGGAMACVCRRNNEIAMHLGKRLPAPPTLVISLAVAIALLGVGLAVWISFVRSRQRERSAKTPLRIVEAPVLALLTVAVGPGIVGVWTSDSPFGSSEPRRLPRVAGAFPADEFQRSA
ncbi:MAG: hypothetical protein EPN34_14855 [Burkholderiaceae bacterium]|nr:MAG: hypothetical protein EPN34_14855 [Burkholderiaceae bacterium]